MKIDYIINNSKPVIERIRKNTKGLFCIYITGSLVEGFGNENSDIDIYVITEDVINVLPNIENYPELLIQNDNCKIQNMIIGETRYDIEYYTLKEVNKIISKLNSFLYCGEVITEQLSYNEQDFLHRLKIGIPILGKNNFIDLYNYIEFEKLILHKAAIYNDGFNVIYEDAFGALHSQDYGSAYLMTLSLINCVNNGYISLFGETNPNEKWLYRMIKSYQMKTKDYSILENYLVHHSLLYKENINKEKFADDVERIFYYSQNLNIRTQKMMKEKFYTY